MGSLAVTSLLPSVLTRPMTAATRLVQRVTAGVITGADLLMRSGLRRLLKGHGIGPVSAAALDELMRDLSRYNDPAILADPDRLLAPPPGRPALAPREHRRLRGGQASHFTFDSPYRPLHEVYAGEYAAYDRVGTVHVHAWEHTHPAPAA